MPEDSGVSKQRSNLMKRIRGENTKPEHLLRSALWSRGARYRLRLRVLGIRPDLVFVGAKVCVFVDGCFWHGCPRDYTRPGSREQFWAEKLRTNLARDRRQTLMLEQEGWTVLRFWEHAVVEELEGVCERIAEAVSSGANARGVDWRVARVDVIDVATRTERRFLEDLRDPSLKRVEEGPRVTKRRRSLVGT